MRARVGIAFAGVWLVLLAAPAAAWTERLEVERRVASLRASDRAERQDAARRLGLAGEHQRAVEALVDALVAEEDVDVRIVIADALARRRDPRAIEALATSVPRMGTDEREARHRALASIDAPAARRALAGALGGDDDESAFTRIVELGAPMIDELLPLLDETLPSRDAAAAAPRAARALGAIGDRRGADALIEHAGASDLAMRAAVLEALGTIGDERAVPAVLAQIGAEDASVAITALRSLARLGSQAEGEAVLAQVRRDDPDVSATALQALAVLDPARARPLLEDALAGARRAPAWAVIVAMPDEAFVPLLVATAADEPTRAEACDALARIDHGGGVAALTELARTHGGDAHVALARSLRRWTEIPSSLRAQALEVIAAEGERDRGALLRAIARDAQVENDVVARLVGGDARSRGAAARALATLGRGSDHAREALRAAIATERDPITLEVMARAQDELGGSADAPVIDDHDDSARLDAALVVASIARPAAHPRARRELRRAILAALHAPSARTRALAAYALGRRGDRAASMAISARLEDGSSEVRVAAARALAVLRGADTARIAERLASRLSIERDVGVRRALRDAIDGAADSSATRGDECLHARLDRPGAVEVQVWLPDGRWLRERTLPSGELVLCDLPNADVDVRLAPRAAPSIVVDPAPVPRAS